MDRDVASRENGVSRGSCPTYTMGDFEDTLSLRGFKSSERTVSQSEASPQQAKSLATVVRANHITLVQMSWA